MSKAIVILAFLLSTSLAAQPLTVGERIADPHEQVSITNHLPASFVDLSSYATADGTVNKASVYWSATCPSAFKVVFLRDNLGKAGSAYSVVATRGPFDAVAGRTDVPLTPPVALTLGDYIGVVQLTQCGTVVSQYYPNHFGSSLLTANDISTTGVVGPFANLAAGLAFGMVAYGSETVLVRVLPAAGAVQGSTAFFRTSVQMVNAGTSAISGRLVFHRATQSASPGDPSLAFNLPGGASLSYADVVASMGTSGLGSLDVVTTAGAVPIITARVFSDAGAAGTSGFSEEAVSPDEALDLFTRGILLLPADLTSFRANIGVRTLDTGATLNISTFDAGGTLRATRQNVHYPANYFEQVPVSQFTGAATLPAGGWILIRLATFGERAFVYSSVIDNRTSDSTFRMADVK